MTDIECRLYSAAQVRELDRRAIEEHGIAGFTLMQRAADACWCEMLARWPEADRIVVVCGPGNNGGDGYEIARLARRAGRQVRVEQVGAVPTQGDAARARQGFEAAGGVEFTGDKVDLVVDALFGTGLARPVDGEARAAIERINHWRAQDAHVLAVDIPSGLAAVSGSVLGVAVQADVTVTFIGLKLGLFTGAAMDHTGEVVFDDLAVPPAVYEDMAPQARCLRRADLAAWLPRRARTAHKGRNGHVLVIGGDSGMCGAALLALRGALRAGAGLVSVATRAAHAPLLTAAQAEAMCHGVESPTQLSPLIERADAVALGPGLGTGDWGRAMLMRVLESTLPLVVDADALNLLAQEPARRDNWVLTPHPGEAARLLGIGTGEVQDDRPAAVRRLRERYGGAVVLKGSGSLVQGERLSVCPFGNPGMAVGGMGDVLSGIIAALIGQGLALDDAACAGVLAHALAGDEAAAGGERGLLPDDLIAALRGVVNP